MVLRAVLSAQADKVSQALGMRSGVEMRAARHAAERIGAQIVLGGSPGPPANPAWESAARRHVTLHFVTALQQPAMCSNVKACAGRRAAERSMLCVLLCESTSFLLGMSLVVQTAEHL